jgi:hypothetical protein
VVLGVFAALKARIATERPEAEEFRRPQ